MPRYDDLEHDTHESPTEETAIPPGMSAPTSAGERRDARSPMHQMRDKMKGESEQPWLSIDNDAIWEGDCFGE